MDKIQNLVFDRIRRSARGKVFASKDFLDLGGRDAIDQAFVVQGTPYLTPKN